MVVLYALLCPHLNSSTYWRSLNNFWLVTPLTPILEKYLPPPPRLSEKPPSAATVSFELLVLEGHTTPQNDHIMWGR